MAGIIAVYSLVIAVLLASDIGPPPTQSYSPFKYAQEPCQNGIHTDSLAADSCISQQDCQWV